MICINGIPDHVHLLIGMRPLQSLSELMQDVKGDSSRWINRKGFLNTKFAWQSGFGAFSYNMSLLPAVIKYIENQEDHHKEKSMAEEYRQFLKLFEVEFDERFIFQPIG